MKVRTPLVLWHGGGMTNGKPDPVFSVDINEHNILVTSGIDSSVPPRGSVHLWKVDENAENQEFLIDFCDHQSAVHVARFSPCGKMLATASDRLIAVYKVASSEVWGTLQDMSNVTRIWIHSSLAEIYDLCWSPDSDFILAGSIDSKAEILKLEGRETIPLTGHTNYVQGVAWDPLNEYVLTQSADRSVKIYALKQPKAGVSGSIKLANRGHGVLKMMMTGVTQPSGGEGETGSSRVLSSHLYASANDSGFFRRPCFTPDGALLLTPMGILPSTANTSFCIHIYSRESMVYQQPSPAGVVSGEGTEKSTSSSGGGLPIVSLAGLEEACVAIRCCPRKFSLIPSPNDAEPLIPGDYRYVFAAVTTASVFIYDTQHRHPLAKISGTHYASINDAAWSKDGKFCIVCSSDGYLTFINVMDEIGCTAT